jgi:hypothetical protein
MPETLAARVFEQEFEAYPEAIRLFDEGLLHFDGRPVRIRSSGQSTSSSKSNPSFVFFRVGPKPLPRPGINCYYFGSRRWDFPRGFSFP